MFYFTDHDTDIVVDGNVYIAASGFSRTALATNAGLAVDNADLDGLLISDVIMPEDLRAGRFDYASLDIFLVNYTAPADGKIQLQRGILGEVVLNERGMFHAELRGLTQALNQVAGEVYGPECRATLGDARCTVNLALLQQAGAVVATIDANGRRVFTTSGFGGGRVLRLRLGRLGDRAQHRRVVRGRHLGPGHGAMRAVPADGLPDQPRRHLHHLPRLRQAADDLQDQVRQRRQLPRLPAHPRPGQADGVPA